MRRLHSLSGEHPIIVEIAVVQERRPEAPSSRDLKKFLVALRIFGAVLFWHIMVSRHHHHPTRITVNEGKQ